MTSLKFLNSNPDDSDGRIVFQGLWLRSEASAEAERVREAGGMIVQLG